jgi:hypothetical protein
MNCGLLTTQVAHVMDCGEKNLKLLRTSKENFGHSPIAGSPYLSHSWKERPEQEQLRLSNISNCSHYSLFCPPFGISCNLLPTRNSPALMPPNPFGCIMRFPRRLSGRLIAAVSLIALSLIIMLSIGERAKAIFGKTDVGKLGKRTGSSTVTFDMPWE